MKYRFVVSPGSLAKSTSQAMPRPGNNITAKQNTNKADDVRLYLVEFVFFLGGVAGGGASLLPG